MCGGMVCLAASDAKVRHNSLTAKRVMDYPAGAGGNDCHILASRLRGDIPVLGGMLRGPWWHVQVLAPVALVHFLLEAEILSSSSRVMPTVPL